MDSRGEYRADSRPPRAQPPRGASHDSHPPTTSSRLQRPPAQPTYGQSNSNVKFQEPDAAFRQQVNARQAARSRNDLPPTPGELGAGEEGGFSDANVRRKKSLVRPDRDKMEPGHPQYHYYNHASQLKADGTNLTIEPSATGNYPQAVPGGLRRGKSLLGRDEDVQESGLAIFKRGGATLRRKRPVSASTPSNASGPGAESGSGKKGCFKNIAPGPINAWMIYCWFLTACIPPFLLKSCGMRTPESQRAWREKMGLMSIISVLMAGVGFLTFGFTQTVCGKPPNRFRAGTVDTGSVIIHGYDYDFSKFKHPAVQGIFTGNSNPLFEGGYNVAAMDLSFMFQYNDGDCRSVITAANGSAIPQTNGALNWYFPCNPFNQLGTSYANKTGYDTSKNCHIKSGTQALVTKTIHRSGQVYYSWDQVKDRRRNLAVYQNTVIDLGLLNWLDTSLVKYPPLFDEMRQPNGTFNGRDITMWVYRNKQQNLAKCLREATIVGFIDTKTIGCVASSVVLYISLCFIIGVVGIRFCMAVIFGWFVSWKIGAFTRETYAQRMQRAAEIEQWTDNIYQPAPSRYRPSVPTAGSAKGGGKQGSQFLPTTSRFSKADALRPPTTLGIPDAPYRKSNTGSSYGSKTLSPSVGQLTPDSNFRNSRSSTSLPSFTDRNQSICPFPLHNVIPQPPSDYEPFNFPLAHAICLVTAYSESLEGLRTTIDSLATTDYPNSHKVILVIADGIVRGSENAMTTPEIVLSLMKEFVIPVEDVEAHSYVAIADGHKRHNMAKVYAGFYDYDDNTVETSKQQRVPIVLVAKCGNPLEATEAKPGNRGKRDSQMVLMAFLQKVMFDERMTTFEYEFFNSLWRVTGVSPDRYEVVLCVDADTKVFPDSLTRMTACMVHDEEIMGLCGETKIANKAETWVTMIQVFEYYISHHLTKAFESMFGGVTCLPGCFSMYRIKAPKGASGYWVPILANPDIVEHYSENVVDTLHKKNLLLLGEDRYLTTLMLKTFPKRKMIFCPQAVCKTVVPDTFSVLLSQRRRWINSTVHNLAELILVRDLCGTFCFSMQFVVGMELAGTLVLPAAIAFTIYLIIISIIPGGPNTTIPLILLAVILGLPGLLIVITSRKIAYLGWMLVYLLSLPIWNFVLPAYAFWHFDDFSWGQTRIVQGETGGNHGDKEGEFDSSHIVMKRWAEFERERRWKGGMQSRDSMYDVIHRNGSPKRMDNRYSMGSSAETYFSDGLISSRQSQQPIYQPGTPDRDYDSSLPLPVPPTYRDTSPSNSSNGIARSIEDEGFTPPTESNSKQRLIPAAEYSSYSPVDEREPIYTRTQPNSSAVGYSPDTHNPFRGAPRTPAYEATYSGYTQEPEELPHQRQTPRSSPRHQRGQSRGFSLVDPGVVPTGESVRRVARKRPTSQTPTTPAPTSRRQSRSSPQTTLPPGAAPPQQYPRYG